MILSKILSSFLAVMFSMNPSTVSAHNLDPNFDNPFQLKRDIESLESSGQFQEAIALQQKYLKVGTEPCRQMALSLETRLLPQPFPLLPNAEALLKRSLQSKTLKEKIKLAIECTERFPNFEFGHLHLARIYSINMWDKKAEEECLKAHALAPANEMVLHQLGAIYIHRRKEKKARAVYEQIVKLNPKDLDADFFFMEMNQSDGKLSNLQLIDRKEIKHASNP